MKTLANFISVGLILLGVGCSKDHNVDPKIETTDATATSAITISVTGNVIETGSFGIKDYGFAYSYSNYVDTSSIKESFGSSPAKGSFQKEITLTPSTYSSYYRVYVRSYLTNIKGTVYGQVLPVDLPSVAVSSVLPLSGKVGDRITITGANFSSTTSENIVTFNSVSATIVEGSATKLVVIVPDGISTPYNVNIQVKAFGATVTATQYFTVLPTCTGFSPQSGTFGTLVTLSGKNLSSGMQVRIGGISASVNFVTSTMITFYVPSNVTSASLPIILSMNGTSIDVPGGNFTINPPVINSFSPDTGIGGTQVTILGSNFNNSNNLVKIGTTIANIQQSNNSSITVTVPTSLGLGTYPISINTGVHTVTATTNFTLSSPQISDFQPQTAARGTYVTITGSNFGSTQGNVSVLFGTNTVYIYSWTDNTIKVQVPSSFPTGTVKITVNTGGQSVVSSGSIVIQ